MRKHILPLLLCLFMVMSLMPTTVLAADGEVSVNYLDESGAAQTVTATEITSGTTIENGWYVVATNTNVSSLTVSGTANIILANGKTLTVSGGIEGSSNALKIYAQTTTDARGALKVQSSGISLNELGIYGGDVTAAGSDCGIKSNGSITIANSAVTANATGTKGTAIQADNNITMTNSTVAATGENGGYGIKVKGNIDIENSTVTVTLSGNGTGIEAENDITIGTGSNVTAMLSGSSATGIHSKTGNVNIFGGTVTSSGGTKAFYASAVTLTDNYADSTKRTVMVNSTATSTNAAKWNETALLTTYKYVRIAPPAPLSTPYLDDHGVLQTVTGAAEITSATTTLENGWYVVNDDVTIGGTVTLTTDTNLILADGKTLTVNVVSGYGIDCGEHDLTIYAQSTSTDMGKLAITTSGEQMYGIRSSIVSPSDITINGGNIDIRTSDTYANGIDFRGTLTINNGVVNITTLGNGSSGICGGEVLVKSGEVNIEKTQGGGAGISVTTGMTITGGYVNITNKGSSSTGISGNSRGAIEIKGGKVDIKNEQGESNGIEITSVDTIISGGNINITNNGATSSGIIINGSSSITIRGGDINIMNNGATSYGIKSSFNIAISGGTVESFAPNGNAFDGTVILGGDYANSLNRTVLVGSSRTVNAEWNGTSPLNTNDRYVKIMPFTVSYIDEDNTQQTHTATRLSNADNIWGKGWYVVNEDVTITNTVTLTTNTNLILADGKTLTVSATNNGISCNNNNLTIYAQSAGTGKLVITTNNFSADGISSHDSGNIKIVGGDIDISTEGSGSRGIYSDTGNISIYGGTVTASASGTDAYGIVGKNVSISGGTVTATVSGTNIVEAISGYAGVNISENADVTATASGERAIGIYCNNGNVNISGGTVNVTANEEWSFGIVCGGENVNISGGTVNVTVIDDNSVGVGSDKGDVAISGGTVTIIGGYNALYVTTTNAVTLTDNYADPAKRIVMVNTTATSTNAAKWDETTRLDSTDYKYVRIVPLAPVPAPTHGGTPIYWWSNQNPQPESTPTLPDVDTSAGALRNGPASIDKTVWLTGEGLVNNDLLITAPLSDTAAAVLLKNTLGEVIAAYDISLASGKTTTGNALTLHFDLGEKYAGQSFTLLHQKADGTIETFTAIADEKGIVSFSPIYELSPFVLIMNKSKAADTEAPPQTGDSFTAVGFIMIVAALAIAAAAKRKVFDNR